MAVEVRRRVADSRFLGGYVERAEASFDGAVTLADTGRVVAMRMGTNLLT